MLVKFYNRLGARLSPFRSFILYLLAAALAAWLGLMVLGTAAEDPYAFLAAIVVIWCCTLLAISGYFPLELPTIGPHDRWWARCKIRLRLAYVFCVTLVLTLTTLLVAVASVRLIRQVIE